MVLRQVGNDTDKLMSKFGLLGKSFANIKKDFQSGQGIRSFGNIVTKNDVSNFQKFNDELKSGTTFHKAYNANLSKSHTYIQQQALEIKKLYTQQKLLERQRRYNKITEQEYNAQLTANKAQIQAITTQTTALTSAQRVGAKFAKVWAMAQNMLLNIAVAATINLIITGITKLVNRQKELQESAKESSDKIAEQTSALEDLKQKYIDIVDSEESDIKKIQELNEWKNTLIKTYGLEKDALENINLEREKGLDLIDQEIAKQNRISRNKWLDENEKAIQKSNEKMSGSGQDYFQIPDGEKIADSIAKLFDGKEILEYGIINFDFDYEDQVDKLEKLNAIYNEIVSIQSKRGLTDAEKTLLEEVKRHKEYTQKIYDEYNSTYETESDYVAKNLIENSLETKDIGKENFQDWKKGLLSEANNPAQKRAVEEAIAEMFPDYQKYFDNLTKARNMFLWKPDSVNAGASAVEYETKKEKFLLGLSDEDLEIATQIPNLFKNGLDSASRAIENWKKDPKNRIEADVDTSNIEDLSAVLDTASKKQSALKSAMEDMDENGYLSASTYATLVELGGNFAECLEVQNGRLVLNIEKLKELEAAEYDTAIAAKELEIAKWKAINAASLKGDFSNQKELEEMERELAFLNQMRDEWNNTKPDDKSGGGGSSDDDKPKSIIDFETELARRQHEIKMGRMEEDEAYFDWLEKAYREAYKGLTGYQDDIYKYEEMVYDGRKKLAEDFYNEQKKYHENRVEELESQITVAENKSVDNNGNSLNPSEKFDYIHDSYSDLIAENERRINEIMQSGIEGHEDEVKELERQIEEYADKLQNVFKDEIDYEIDYIETLQDKYNDFIDSRIDRYEDEKKAIEDKYDAEIKSIDDTIDALKDKNDETKTAIDLKKAEQDLENAKQRTRMVYGADGTVSYRQDTDKVEEAQQKVDDLKLDMLLDSLEKQKEAKEAEKDAALQTYETMIDDLEQQKKDRDEFFETVIEKLDNINNPQPTEGIDRVIDKTYDDPSEANEVKQGLKDVENAVKDGTEQAKDNANEAKKADNKSQSANSKTVTKSNQTEQTSNMDSFMKLLYSMSGKEPDGYERWKRGEYDEGNKLMSNIFSDNAFMSGAMKPFEDAMNSFNETVNKMNAVNAAGQQSANITIGDININNPVRNTKQLAEAIKNELHKEALMEIPNAAMKTIHSNLK